MSFEPEVSVIVPVFNESLTLNECIESLLSLHYPRYELIFVNNGSSDETGSILNSYRNRIQIIEEKRRGPSAARNAGLNRSTREIIAFTDADCIADPDWLTNLVAPLNDSTIGITGGLILSRPQANSIEKFAEEIYDQHDAISVFKPPYAITMNWASRLSVLKEHNFFDENFLRCEDVDLSYRIYQSGYKLVFQSNAIIYHHNERTLKELFQKGFLHGFHSIKIYKQYRKYVQSFGHRRWNSHSYRVLYNSFLRSIIKRDRNSGYSFVFNAGKKIGKISGSIRFSYIDL